MAIAPFGNYDLKTYKRVENTIVIVISIALLLIIAPLLFFIRRSTDIRLKGNVLVLRYPFTKEAIDLSKELKSWHLQEAYFLRLGKVHSINIELQNGKWKSVSSRFNADSFQSIFKHLETNFGKLRKADNKMN